MSSFVFYILSDFNPFCLRLSIGSKFHSMLFPIQYFVMFLSSISSFFSMDSILVSTLANFESKFLCNFSTSVCSVVVAVWSVCWLMIICLAALTMFFPTSSTLQ